MLTNRTTQWTAGAALLCVAVLAASWFLLIAPKRTHAADLRAQTQVATGQAQQAQAQTARLKAQFADLPQQKAELAAVKAQLPPKANVPALVSDLQAQAAAAGVSLNSIVPGTPAMVGSAAGTSSNTLAAAGSVVAIPLTVTAAGDYFEDALFVKYLQTKLTRSFLVNTVTTTTSAAGSTATAAQTTSTQPTPTNPAAPTPAATPSSSTGSSTGTGQVQLSIGGSVFVLLDGSSTLGQVAKDAQQATTGSSN